MNLRDYMSAIALDCAGKDCEKKDKQAVLDAVNERATDFVLADTKMRGARVVQAWSEIDQDDLRDGETLATAFEDLIFEAADINSDGDIGEDEETILNAIADAACEYLASKGVTDADITALAEGNDEAAERIRDLLVDELPDGDDAEDDIENFAFADDENESVLDSGNYSGKVEGRSVGGKWGNAHISTWSADRRRKQAYRMRKFMKNGGARKLNRKVYRLKAAKTRRRNKSHYKKRR